MVEGVVPDFPDPVRHGPAKVGDGPPVGLSADLVGDLPGGGDGAGASGGNVRLGFPSGLTFPGPLLVELAVVVDGGEAARAAGRATSRCPRQDSNLRPTA